LTAQKGPIRALERANEHADRSRLGHGSPLHGSTECTNGLRTVYYRLRTVQMGHGAAAPSRAPDAPPLRQRQNQHATQDRRQENGRRTWSNTVHHGRLLPQRLPSADACRPGPLAPSSCTSTVARRRKVCRRRGPSLTLQGDSALRGRGLHGHRRQGWHKVFNEPTACTRGAGTSTAS